jgi:hypothetical protein
VPAFNPSAPVFNPSAPTFTPSAAAPSTPAQTAALLRRPGSAVSTTARQQLFGFVKSVSWRTIRILIHSHELTSAFQQLRIVKLKSISKI